MGYDPERDRLARQQEEARLARQREEARLEGRRIRASEEAQRHRANEDSKVASNMRALFASQGLDQFGNPLAPRHAAPERKLTVIKDVYRLDHASGNVMDLGQPGLIGILEFEHPEIDGLRAFWLANHEGFPRRPYLGVRWPAWAPGKQFGTAHEDMSHRWTRCIGGGIAFPLEVRTRGLVREIEMRWLPPSTAAWVTQDEARQLLRGPSPWGDPNFPP